MSNNCQTDTFPNARRDHFCVECGGFIRKGTTYHKQTGIFEGLPYTWKAHKDCAGLLFMMTKDAGCYWDEDMPLSEYGVDEIQLYRGYFPHAVCRIEFIRSKRTTAGKEEDT